MLTVTCGVWGTIWHKAKFWRDYLVTVWGERGTHSHSLTPVPQPVKGKDYSFMGHSVFIELTCWHFIIPGRWSGILFPDRYMYSRRQLFLGLEDNFWYFWRNENSLQTANYLIGIQRFLPGPCRWLWSMGSIKSLYWFTVKLPSCFTSIPKARPGTVLTQWPMNNVNEHGHSDSKAGENTIQKPLSLSHNRVFFPICTWMWEIN